MFNSIKKIEKKFLKKVSDKDLSHSKPAKRLSVYRNTLDYLANDVIHKPKNRDLITKKFIDDILREQLSKMITRLRTEARVLHADFSTIVQKIYEVNAELEVVSKLKAERVGVRDLGTITREIANSFNLVEQNLNEIIEYIDTEIEDLKQ